MNDFELNQQLHALRPPELKEEYWADFPGRVTVKIRRQPRFRPPPERGAWAPQLAWGMCLGLGCLVLGYFIGHYGVPKSVSRALVQNQRQIHATAAALEGNLESFMLDEQDLQKLAPDPAQN